MEGNPSTLPHSQHQRTLNLRLSQNRLLTAALNKEREIASGSLSQLQNGLGKPENGFQEQSDVLIHTNGSLWTCRDRFTSRRKRPGNSLLGHIQGQRGGHLSRLLVHFQHTPLLFLTRSSRTECVRLNVLRNMDKKRSTERFFLTENQISRGSYYLHLAWHIAVGGTSRPCFIQF